MTKIKKRIISLSLLFAFLLTGVGGKLYKISSASSIYASQNSSTRLKEIAKTRGMIYDRNFKKLVNGETENYIIVKPTAKGLTETSGLENADEIHTVLKTGELYIGRAPENAVENSEDVLNTSIIKRYTTESLCQIIGYTNSEGNGMCGIEKAYDDILNEASGTLSAVYKTDALGRVLTSEPIEIRDSGFNSPEGVVLTIDADIQKITEAALINGGIKKGAAVVLNVKTGEISASVSLPFYNQSSPEKSFDNTDSPFINRAFSAYSVGSVFKVVTAAASIENNIDKESFTCSGSTEKSGVTFFCNNKKGHGKLGLEDALSVSCNPYFIELATEVGREELLKYTHSLGFGEKTELSGITASSGTVPALNELDSDAALGNFGFGQGSLTATPLQLACCYNTFARDGKYITPTLVKGTVNKDGSYNELSSASKEYEAVKPETAKIINKYLHTVMTEGTGTRGKSEYFNSCGKTATAETGQADENGRAIYNTWFVGFFPYEDPEYTVCILKEDGASGSFDDAPIFKEISENIYFSKMLG